MQRSSEFPILTPPKFALRAQAGLKSVNQASALRASAPSLARSQMGSWFSDVTGIDVNVAGTINNLSNSVWQGFVHLGGQIQNLTWAQIGGILQDAIRLAANIYIETNTLHLIYMGLSTNPITGHMFMELDKVTGGLLTTANNVTTLPARAARGDPISKAELIDDALFAIKVAVIVISGGTATPIISASSAQLGKGTLGQTGLGKATIGVAGTLVGGGGVLTAVENLALSAAQTEAIKKSPLGQTELGKLAIGASFAAGGGELTGGGYESGLTSFAKGTAVTQAGRVAPGGGLAAGYLIDNAGNLISSSGDSSKDAESSSPWSFDLTSIPGKIADAFSNISIDLPSLGGGGGIDLSKISIPDITAPSIDIAAIEINIGQIPDIQLPSGKKKVASKQKKIVKGKRVTRYMMADGTAIDVADTSVMEAGISPLILIGGVILVLALRRRK